MTSYMDLVSGSAQCVYQKFYACHCSAHAQSQPPPEEIRKFAFDRHIFRDSTKGQYSLPHPSLSRTWDHPAEAGALLRSTEPKPRGCFYPCNRAVDLCPGTQAMQCRWFALSSHRGDVIPKHPTEEPVRHYAPPISPYLRRWGERRKSGILWHGWTQNIW